MFFNTAMETRHKLRLGNKKEAGYNSQPPSLTMFKNNRN